jgi:hypothetical protein
MLSVQWCGFRIAGANATFRCIGRSVGTLRGRPLPSCDCIWCSHPSLAGPEDPRGAQAALICPSGDVRPDTDEQTRNIVDLLRKADSKLSVLIELCPTCVLESPWGRIQGLFSYSKSGRWAEGGL